MHPLSEPFSEPVPFQPWWVDFLEGGINLLVMFGIQSCPRGIFFRRLGIYLGLLFLNSWASAAENPPPVPRFSMSYVDRSVDPKTNFYQYATGAWRKNNPVPSDKSRWAGFDELQERNWWLIRGILISAAAETNAPAGSPLRQVGDFYAAAMETNRIERLGFAPLDPEWERLKAVQDPESAMALLADWHLRGIGAGFGMGVQPDAKNSSVYALHLMQGGLGLPDRDYYLAEGFARQREQYRQHIAAQLRLLGDGESEAKDAAEAILALETRLAKASRTRTELRDREKNYHKLTRAELDQLTPRLPWGAYFQAAGIASPATVIVGQPEFFKELDLMVSEVEENHWLAYLQWHLVSSLAEHLHAAPANEAFAFYGTVLRGQPQQEPRWQRSAKSIDGALGEALGRLYVEKHFPPAASARMSEMIANLRVVGSKLFFVGDDGVLGEELWVFDLGAQNGALAQNYGSSQCPGTANRTPRIAAVGLPTIGNGSFAVDCDNALPNSLAVLFVALAPSAAVLDTCRVLLGLPATAAATVPTTATGTARTPFPIPANAALNGMQLFGQYVVLDPLGPLFGDFSLSDGLWLRVGP